MNVNISVPNSLTPEQEQYLRRQPIGDVVINALRSLLEHDRYLLEVNANERSITFRFALYLQSQLPDWTVDCEYNRDGIDPKRLGHLDVDPDSEDDEAKTVFPDVIAHRRGREDNLIVLEFKKSTSRVDREIDRRKLLGYKRQLGYTYGLFIEVATDTNQANISQLEWV